MFLPYDGNWVVVQKASSLGLSSEQSSGGQYGHQHAVARDTV